MDTTGLLLFTTDGDLGQRLLHPSHHVETYRAIVDGRCLDGDLEPLRAGHPPTAPSCSPARTRPRRSRTSAIPQPFPRSLRTMAV